MINFRLRVIFSLAVCVLFTNTGFAFDGGTGQLDDPYQISTSEHLISIGSNADLLGKHYVMVADVNMAEYTFTTAVIAPDTETTEGFQWNPFSGTFDGNGFEIKKLTIDTLSDNDPTNDDNDYLGLFGCIANGVVKNMRLQDSVIRGSGNSLNIGGLAALVAGNSKSTIQNCNITCMINGGTCVGGLVGANQRVGTIEECYSSGYVQGNVFVGGLVGDNRGNYEEGFIRNSYSSAEVSGILSNIGGLVGRNSGIIQNCNSSGSVNGDTDSIFIGGLVGHNNEGYITDCYSISNIEGEGESVGGLVGANRGNITTCYSIGTIAGSGSLGGLVGNAYSGTVTGCFWDTEASGMATSTAGTGKTTVEMKSLSTYVEADWDINTHDGDMADWYHVVDSYPELTWNTILEVPDVNGMTESQAQNILSESGFGFSIKYIYSDVIPFDIVINQEPSAGSLVRAGLSVDVYVSHGPLLYSGGSGTLEDPYQIATAEELVFINTDTDFLSKNFILVSDIDLSDFVFTSAIISPDTDLADSFQGTAFTGLLDGDGHKIVNLKIDTLSDSDSSNDDNDYLGLFGVIADGALLKNLSLQNVTVIGSSQSDNVGGLVGWNLKSTVRNCNTSGLCEGGTLVGGLVGNNRLSTIEECYSEGSVSGKQFIGGMVGDNSAGDIKRCCSSVEASGIISNISGLVGRNSGNIFYCNSSGTVNVESGSRFIGGLVGHNTQGTISNCFSTSNLEGEGESVGGLIGANGGNVTNCYSIGSVNGMNLLGGFAGNAYGGTVNGCFWDIEASGMATSTAGTGKTTTEMKSLSTFIDANWDFSTDDGDIADWYHVLDSYPGLTWNTVLEVPDLYGLTQAQALDRLTDSGFNAIIRNYYSDTVPAGNVIDQQPFAGSLVQAGLAVVLDISLGQGYSGGSGTSESPCVLSSLEDFITMSQMPNDYSKHFILTTNIDLSGYVFDMAVISPDGDNANSLFDGDAFTGTFDGNGYKIMNLAIDTLADGDSSNDNNDYLSLFGQIGENGSVKNLYIENASINCGYDCSYVGSLAGYNLAGSLIGCTSNLNITGTSKNVGGLVGCNEGTIDSCCSVGSINTNVGSKFIGGFVGHNLNGSITNCYSIIDIIGLGDFVGGLVGNNGGNVSFCYSNGTVSGNSFLGGLIGNLYEGDVSDCFWDNESSGQATSAGGTGKSTSEMKTKTTFTDAGWDFTSDDGDPAVWREVNNYYPVFEWQTLTVIPDVEGLTELNVEAVLTSNGFNMGQIEFFYSDTLSNGLAINTLPYAGTLVPRGIVVDIIISLGKGYSGGSGTEDNPCKIGKSQDLLTLRSRVSDYNKSFRMIDDIDMKPYTFTTALISPDADNYSFEFEGTPFTGTFDGNGYMVDNLTITTSSYSDPNHFYVGLFGKIGCGGCVKNLNINNVKINGNDGNPTYVGALAGYNEGLVTDCNSTGSVSGTGYYIGGLIGFNEGDIANSSSSDNVNGYDKVGGLVGLNNGSLKACFSACSVIGNEGVGGLVGWNYDGVIINSYSIGSVTGDDTIGGLVGYNRENIFSCYSTSTVSGNDYVGGLVGTCPGYIGQSYSSGSVTGNMHVGGLAGSATSSNISKCYSISSLISSNLVCGLVGSGANATINDSFWDIEATGTKFSFGGYGLTTEKMQKMLYYSANNWAGTDWTIDEGKDYPRLIWENIPGEYIQDPLITFDGSGITEDPWIIQSKEDFLAVCTGTSYWKSHYILNSDIDLSGMIFKDALIGYDRDNSFKGSFNGHGHAISNLTIVNENTGNAYVGLFGFVAEGSCVENLILQNANITANVSYIGGIVGRNEGSIISCSSEGFTTGHNYVGGLVGNSTRGLILNCFSEGYVIGNAEYSGGLVGLSSESTIETCYSACNIQGTENVGGLIGRVYLSSINNCYSNGTIEGDRYFGGLIGSKYDTVVKGCFWDKQASGITTSAGGESRITANMKKMANYTFAGWDFENEWWINNERDYPRLSWQPFGDLNNDSHVNTADLAIMSANWMMDINNEGVDRRCELSGDDVIGMDDLSIIIEAWLEGPQFGD